MRAVATSIVLGSLFLGPLARADAAASCRPPSWAPNGLPGFAIGSCEERSWDQVEEYLDGKRTLLEGRRSSVTYKLQDPSKNPTTAVAREFYVDQAKKAGAAVKRDKDYEAALEKTGPDGDFWYLWSHGSGNERSTTSYTVTTVKIEPLPQRVETRPMPAAPLDASGASCNDPPWLVRGLPGYSRKSCDAKAFDKDEFHLDSGEVELSGKRVTVRYGLDDESQAQVAAAAFGNFLAALRKSGAEILRGNKGGHTDWLMATQTSPAGQSWLIYEQAGGNGDHVSGYRLTTWQSAPFDQEVEAQPLKGPMELSDCKDPEWLVKQFAYFKRGPCRNRDFDSVEIQTRDGKKKLAGHVHEVTYQLTDPTKNPTALTVWTNYVEALKRIGAELVSSPRDANLAVFTLNSPQGETWIVYQHGSGSAQSTTSYSLMTLQAGGPAPKKCRMEIYGVSFDFDKATLRPDAEPVLEALLGLFKSDPRLSGEISGHTDNVGKPAYNLKLSGERAEAVKGWLVSHGVAPNRITTRGYGETRPLVPNTTEENRARNRRVELTRQNCSGT